MAHDRSTATRGVHNRLSAITHCDLAISIDIKELERPAEAFLIVSACRLPLLSPDGSLCIKRQAHLGPKLPATPGKLLPCIPVTHGVPANLLPGRPADVACCVAVLCYQCLNLTFLDWKAQRSQRHLYSPRTQAATLLWQALARSMRCSCPLTLSSRYSKPPLLSLSNRAKAS